MSIDDWGDQVAEMATLADGKVSAELVYKILEENKKLKAKLARFEAAEGKLPEEPWMRHAAERSEFIRRPAHSQTLSEERDLSNLQDIEVRRYIVQLRTYAIAATARAYAAIDESNKRQREQAEAYAKLYTEKSFSDKRADANELDAEQFRKWKSYIDDARKQEKNMTFDQWFTDWLHRVKAPASEMDEAKCAAREVWNLKEIEISALRARADANEKDAERYRWIRSTDSPTAQVMQKHLSDDMLIMRYGIDLDAAIDAAKQEKV